MPKISLEEAEPSMIVAEEIVSPQGRMLLGEGVILTEKYIRILKTWGVNALIIEGEEEVIESIPLPTELLQQAAEEVKPRFIKSNLKHPVVAYLYKARIKTRAIELNKYNDKENL